MIFVVVLINNKSRPVEATSIKISTIAEKDSYVDSGNPTSNYGGKDWILFGNHFSDFTATYLYFNFSDKPAEWTKAEISIDCYFVSETFKATVSLINDDWEELTINWMNEPEHGEIITTLTISEEKIYYIDVSDYIAGRDNISICINASDYTQNGYIQATSSEGYYIEEEAPHLIWCLGEDESNDSYPEHFTVIDSYVDSGNPSSNYGGKDWILFGNHFSDFTQAYFAFNLSEKPTDWIKAEISIDCYYVSETFKATVSLINDDWGELTINWMNKPEHGEIITTLTISEEKIYYIDVSDYIAGRNNISICINASDYTQNGYVQATSSEGYYLEKDAPQIIWTRESDDNGINDGENSLGGGSADDNDDQTENNANEDEEKESGETALEIPGYNIIYLLSIAGIFVAIFIASDLRKTTKKITF
ncbi:MAG: CBM96 family carbohydrate-binding protein [Promethearchaeota archaeon]